MAVKPSEIAALQKRISDLEKAVSDQTQAIARHGPQELSPQAGDVIECRLAYGQVGQEYQEVDMYDIVVVYDIVDSPDAYRLPRAEKYTRDKWRDYDDCNNRGVIGIALNYAGGYINDGSAFIKLYVQVAGVQYARLDTKERISYSRQRYTGGVWPGSFLRPNDDGKLELDAGQTNSHFQAVQPADIATEYNTDVDDLVLVRFVNHFGSQGLCNVIYDDDNEEYTVTFEQNCFTDRSHIKTFLQYGSVNDLIFKFKKPDKDIMIYFYVTDRAELVGKVYIYPLHNLLWTTSSYASIGDLTTDTNTIETARGIGANSSYLYRYATQLVGIGFSNDGSYSFFADAYPYYARHNYPSVVNTNGDYYGSHLHYNEQTKKLSFRNYRSPHLDGWNPDNWDAATALIDVPVSTESKVYYSVDSDILTFDPAGDGTIANYWVGTITTDADGKIVQLDDRTVSVNLPMHHVAYVGSIPVAGSDQDGVCRAKVNEILTALSAADII